MVDDATRSAKLRNSFESLALEREVGTILDVVWHAERATFRGAVEKHENGQSFVFHLVDGDRRWHDFDRDKSNAPSQLSNRRPTRLHGCAAPKWAT